MPQHRLPDTSLQAKTLLLKRLKKLLLFLDISTGFRAERRLAYVTGLAGVQATPLLAISGNLTNLFVFSRQQREDFVSGLLYMGNFAF